MNSNLKKSTFDPNSNELKKYGTFKNKQKVTQDPGTQNVYYPDEETKQAIIT